MKCLHPVTIIDPHDSHRKIHVSCGKCVACLHNRQVAWSKRLQVEASQHKYVFFVTLTYSDKYVPVFHCEDVFDYPYFTERQRDQAQSFLEHLSPWYGTKEEYELLSDKERDKFISPSYLVLRYSDVQLFLKRLRKYINENNDIPKQGKYLRFYCAGEYGESTARPHYHLLFFSDEPILCERNSFYDDRGIRQFTSLLEMYVRKAWSIFDAATNTREQIGRVDFQRDKGESANYTSKYLNCLTDIPRALREIVAFRPFSRASTSPPIGTNSFTLEDAKKTILGGFNEFYNESGSEALGNRFVQLPKALKDSLFPRCKSFSLLSYSDRQLLLSIAFYPEVGSSYSEFREWLYQNQNSDLCQLIRDVFEFEGVGDLYQLNQISNRSLRRLWNQSRLALFNANILNVDFTKYCGLISKFYDDQNYNNLISQLTEEQTLAQNYGVEYLPLFIDPLFKENLDVSSCDNLLKTFGLDIGCDITKYNFRVLPEYKEKDDIIISYVQTGKTYKRKKDYLSRGLSNQNTI